MRGARVRAAGASVIAGREGVHGGAPVVAGRFHRVIRRRVLTPSRCACWSRPGRSAPGRAALRAGVRCRRRSRPPPAASSPRRPGSRAGAPGPAAAAGAPGGGQFVQFLPHAGRGAARPGGPAIGGRDRPAARRESVAAIRPGWPAGAVRCRVPASGGAGGPGPLRGAGDHQQPAASAQPGRWPPAWRTRPGAGRWPGANRPPAAARAPAPAPQASAAARRVRPAGPPAARRTGRGRRRAASGRRRAAQGSSGGRRRRRHGCAPAPARPRPGGPAARAAIAGRRRSPGTGGRPGRRVPGAGRRDPPAGPLPARSPAPGAARRPLREGTCTRCRLAASAGSSRVRRRPARRVAAWCRSPCSGSPFSSHQVAVSGSVGKRGGARRARVRSFRVGWGPAAAGAARRGAVHFQAQVAGQVQASFAQFGGEVRGNGGCPRPGHGCSIRGPAAAAARRRPARSRSPGRGGPAPGCGRCRVEAFEGGQLLGAGGVEVEGAAAQGGDEGAQALQVGAAQGSRRSSWLLSARGWGLPSWPGRGAAARRGGRSSSFSRRW